MPGSEVCVAQGQLRVLPQGPASAGWRGTGGPQEPGVAALHMAKNRVICGEQCGAQRWGPFSHLKPLSCLLGCLAWPWCGHNPDTAATVCPAVGWGTRAQGPLCGLSGDLHPALNNRVESQAGAGPRVVCCESAPSEQMKAGRWLAGGQWAGRRAAPSQGRNWGSHGPGVD